MSGNLVESLIGALVLIVAGWFLTYAYQQTDGAVSEGYVLSARFDKIDGLSVGSDVRMSGIKIGSVLDSRLDEITYQAIVRFSVAPDIQVPSDTAALITSESLLGGKYLSLSPGGMDDMLADGDEISETQDSIDLMGLLGKFMVGDKSGTGSETQQ